jgi:biopolymer transport protein ExbD
MLNLRTRRRERVDVAESGALSDLAFLLIIFFIVIAVFNINSGFLLGLPQRNSVTTVQSDDLMRVTVSADNRFELDGDFVDLATLRTAVLGRRQRQPNMTLVVAIHPESSYQSLVSLVELARTADVDNFSFRIDSP